MCAPARAGVEASDPRVLSILSAGHHKVYKAWESDFLTKKAGMAERTFAAGFYGDCAGAALARTHPQLTLVHAYPGFVSTNWWRELPWMLRPIAKRLQKTGKPLEDCGEFMAYALLNDHFVAGFHSLTEFAEPCAHCASDTAVADGVWKKTLDAYKATGVAA